MADPQEQVDTHTLGLAALAGSWMMSGRAAAPRVTHHRIRHIHYAAAHDMEHDEDQDHGANTSNRRGGVGHPYRRRVRGRTGGEGRHGGRGKMSLRDTAQDIEPGPCQPVVTQRKRRWTIAVDSGEDLSTEDAADLRAARLRVTADE